MTSGTIVKHTDGMAGIVEGLHEVPVNGRRTIDVGATVIVEKASGVAITAGTKVKITPSTQVASTGAPTDPEFYIGTATDTAAIGTTEVSVALNGQGPTT